MIGFCAYAIVNNLWQEGRISYVYAMVVDEAHRGKGYGKQLIQAFLDMSRTQGLKRMELDSAFQRLQAHEFYEHLGFAKERLSVFLSALTCEQTLHIIILLKLSDLFCLIYLRSRRKADISVSVCAVPEPDRHTRLHLERALPHGRVYPGRY